MQQDLLTKCPVCGGTVSKGAFQCPHCGESLWFLTRSVQFKDPETWLYPLLILFVGLPVFALCLCFGLAILVRWL